MEIVLVMQLILIPHNVHLKYVVIQKQQMNKPVKHILINVYIVSY